MKNTLWSANYERDKLYDCLEELAKHHNKVSAHFEGYYPITPSEQRIESFKSELKSGKSSISVIEDDQKVVGFCKVSADDGKGVLEYLVVLEQERGHGYGAELMDWEMYLNLKRNMQSTGISIRKSFTKRL